jgi:NifU-like protein involved in Fe-S cluster formation
MATVLYTPQLLELATSLSAYPWDDSLPLQSAARSKSCGSAVTVGIARDADLCIAQVGIKAQACAVGQAAAAIFAGAANGRSASDVEQAEKSISSWLSGEGSQPDWPGLDAVVAAKAYPARHAAILLPWQAARQALSSDDKAR